MFIVCIVILEYVSLKSHAGLNTLQKKMYVCDKNDSYLEAYKVLATLEIHRLCEDQFPRVLSSPDSCRKETCELTKYYITIN